MTDSNIGNRCPIPGCDRGPATHWHPIGNSSILRDAAYDAPAHRLYLRFLSTGVVYSYQDVPDDVLLALLTAPSPGKFFHVEVRNVYTACAIPIEETCACCGSYWSCSCEFDAAPAEVISDERGIVTAPVLACRAHGQEVPY